MGNLRFTKNILLNSFLRGRVVVKWGITLYQDELDMANYSYDKGDTSSMKGIQARLEENITDAVNQLKGCTDEKLMENWVMLHGGKPMMEPMPKIQVVRSFLMNHLYHHRGELVAFLRANGKPVPGLYGPSYEESMAMQS